MSAGNASVPLASRGTLLAAAVAVVRPRVECEEQRALHRRGIQRVIELLAHPSVRWVAGAMSHAGHEIIRVYGESGRSALPSGGVCSSEAVFTQYSLAE